VYQIKASVFNYLTKNQKSHLCSHLRSLTKRYSGLSAQEITDEFIEEETHFAQLDGSRFYFAVENFNNDIFLKDLKKFIEALIKDNEYKKAMKEEMAPLREQQKEYMRQQRKLAQEYKMDREKPTKKQISYYLSLCKSKNIEPKELEGASKLALKKYIEELVGNA